MQKHIPILHWFLMITSVPPFPCWRIRTQVLCRSPIQLCGTRRVPSSREEKSPLAVLSLELCSNAGEGRRAPSFVQCTQWLLYTIAIYYSHPMNTNNGQGKRVSPFFCLIKMWLPVIQYSFLVPLMTGNCYRQFNVKTL